MSDKLNAQLSPRRNFNIERRGHTVTVTFSDDPEVVAPTSSASGKSLLVASTGTVRLDGGLCVSLNAYWPKN